MCRFCGVKANLLCRGEAGRETFDMFLEEDCQEFGGGMSDMLFEL